MIQVPIPTELEPFVQGVVDSGSYRNPTEVVGEALRLLARREQLLHDVKAGVEQFDRGEYTEYGEDSQETFWPTSRPKRKPVFRKRKTADEPVSSLAIGQERSRRHSTLHSAGQTRRSRQACVCWRIQ